MRKPPAVARRIIQLAAELNIGRGGAREGSGRKKIRNKKRAFSFKLPMKTRHALARLARARKVSLAVALEMAIDEHAAILNGEQPILTWGGVQTTIDGASIAD